MWYNKKVYWTNIILWKGVINMCGICGFTGMLENRDEVLKNMTEVITHRGPDSDGFYIGEDINMGFRRLSIIDINTGHQPIYNEDKTLVLTFKIGRAHV